MPRPANPHPYHKIVTRWRLPDGKQVPPRTPGAVKHTERSSTYYADVAGRTIALKTTFLDIAWKRLRDRLREEHERELGIRSNFSDHARAAIEEHLQAWLAVLEAKGTAAAHRDTVGHRLRKLFAQARWQRLAQITADGAELALASMQAQGMAAQTRNHYVTHLRGFCAWLVRSGRLPQNPVYELGKINTATDRRHDRRSPQPAEIAELFRYLEQPAAPVRRGLSGPQRALAYKVAMATGYRAGELRTLTAESFDLSAGTVALAAAADKRRKGDVHPLPPWLVQELSKWFAAGGALWQRLGADALGDVLHADLDGARQAWIAAASDAADKKWRQESPFLCYKTEGPNGPLFWDFHSLRVYYVSALAAQPGMDLKTLMTLARHSTPQLSLNVYAKAREDNLRAAVNQLPPPGAE